MTNAFYLYANFLKNWDFSQNSPYILYRKSHREAIIYKEMDREKTAGERHAAYDEAKKKGARSARAPSVAKTY
jgi:hypothetical protein